jgi:hypothetical protein
MFIRKKAEQAEKQEQKVNSVMDRKNIFLIIGLTLLFLALLF